MTVDPEAKLARAKDRLYVLCQVVGWGGMLAIQLFYQSLGTNPRSSARGMEESITTMILLVGLLLTHYARFLVKRWSWMELGWSALLPRVGALATVMSMTWSVVSFGYVYGILQLCWTSKLSPAFAVVATTFNGVCIFLAWFGVYFIYHAFERLRRMQVERLHLAASVKEAELRALKSQVNPHFLFNSLNSLRALIDEDAPRARESVTRLANMLRYSLQSGQLETVALEEELRIVEDYLALEQIRHEDRLRVRWQLENEATLRGLPVPPMLLQTLVENAVKYGISARREGGEIVISASLTGAALHLRVTNPGDLAAPASASAARAGSSTGVGLRNASDRLKLLFGDRATLTVLAEPAGCVTADVYIPLNPPAR
jgi:sensor histidine kinase YesM